jgi:sugar phosphate isomerase/epimerase
MSNISVACYSLRDEIKTIGMDGMADFLNEIGVENVEINTIYTKAENLQEDVKAFEAKGIKTVLATLDGNNFFMPADAEEDRKDQFDMLKPWLDAAAAAGIGVFRSNMGHPLGIFKNKKKMLQDIVDTFRPIQEYAESLGITYVFENHGGPSSDVDFQLKVKQAFPSDKMGFLLDTGNYDPKKLVYENIKKLGSSIKIVHAKTYEFDENGEETQLDFKRIIEGLKAVGFDGYYSIEFEGKGSNREGVKSAVALLQKYL